MGIFLQGESLHQYHRRINAEHTGELPRVYYDEPFIEYRGPWCDSVAYAQGSICRCAFGGEFAGYTKPIDFYSDYILAVRGRLEVAA